MQGANILATCLGCIGSQRAGGGLVLAVVKLTCKVMFGFMPALRQNIGVIKSSIVEQPVHRR